MIEGRYPVRSYDLDGERAQMLAFDAVGIKRGAPWERARWHREYADGRAEQGNEIAHILRAATGERGWGVAYDRRAGVFVVAHLAPAANVGAEADVVRECASTVVEVEDVEVAGSQEGGDRPAALYRVSVVES